MTGDAAAALLAAVLDWDEARDGDTFTLELKADALDAAICDYRSALNKKAKP